jgi:hypothetical protein
MLDAFVDMLLGFGSGVRLDGRGCFVHVGE